MVYALERGKTDPMTFMRRNPTVATTCERRCIVRSPPCEFTEEQVTKAAMMLAGTPFLKKSILER
jgi:hypothetical protein